ncbi:MAG TPA: hypothetical protein VMH81_17375 [Bryobacteraceae bacterium]|nr:hypothetical protein [Bryobacteraceae bacterium]
MSVRNLSFPVLLAAAISYPMVAGDSRAKPTKPPVVENAAPVLWHDPTDIATRDLFYGPGGHPHEPRGTFTFLKEDLGGTNPKFVVKDESGTKWKVKLGLEARPETVASRIVWAAGYYANEDYFMPELHVQGMPPRLHRGWKLVSPDGTVHNVRLKRESREEKKIGNWRWRENPFTNTREMNGLKVMMALINNWDLKDENNAIYQEGSEQIYMVSDLGASFGTDGRSWPPEKGKGNLESYEKSVFVRHVSDNLVDFRVPARPRWVFLVNPKEYFRRIGLEWIGHRVPRSDARWMGEVLSHLSKNQIRDAFRAAGYSPAQVEGFSKILEDRIITLTDL